jgi:uncharacterized protein (TIGR02453 family)
MSFTGFPKGAERFWHELAGEMSREWFAAHKGEYEELWLRPMEAMLEDVRAAIAPAYKAVGLAKPKIFRIHRDVRFSKDKTPYKTHIAGLLSTGKGGSGVTEQAAALYVSFGMEEFAAAGLWHFGPEQLARWRKRLLDGKKGGEIGKLAAAATKRGWTLDGEDSTVRVPRGFSDDHPRAELAKRKGFAVGFPPLAKGLIYKPALVRALADRAIAAAPLVTWLAKNVA